MSLVESFRTTTPNRQLAVFALSAAGIGAVLIAVYLLVLRQPYDVLFDGLRPADAATIVAELDKKKVPYRLKDRGATILVPKDKVDGTRLGIMSEDLPIKGTVGFELFNKSDMGLTEFAQKINYQRALQGELARTIMTIDVVDAARVHLSLGEQTIFRDDRRPPKASVTLIPRLGKQLEPGIVRGIQRLVAAAVPELEAANVVILDAHGELLSSDAAVGGVAPAAPDQKQAIEQFYAARVRRALAPLDPSATVEVTASAPVPATPSDTENLSASPFDSWTPTTRGFGVSVAVSTTAPLTVETQEQIRAAASDAVGLDPALGDLVTVSPATPAWAEPVAAGPATPTAPLGAAPKASPSAFWMALLGGLLVLLLAAAVGIHRRRGGGRRLSERQRQDYGERLRLLLDEGAVHAQRP